MAREVGNANTSYFKVDADGFIYLASKVEMDGYKPHYNDEGNLQVTVNYLQQLTKVRL